MKTIDRISDQQWTATATDLRRAREARGWTQYQVALALGSTAPTVSNWETGRSTPSAVCRAKLVELFGAEALGLDLTE